MNLRGSCNTADLGSGAPRQTALKPQRIREWISVHAPAFRERDLRFLIRQVFAVDSPFSLDADALLMDSSRRMLERALQLYTQGMPLAYILGKEEFFGLEFLVNHCVLIPRPETEVIVQKAIAIIDATAANRVLDLCCGSAAIAVSVGVSIDRVLQMSASDVSCEALRVARANALRHRVGDR